MKGYFAFLSTYFHHFRKFFGDFPDQISNLGMFSVFLDSDSDQCIQTNFSTNAQRMIQMLLNQPGWVEVACVDTRAARSAQEGQSGSSVVKT